MISSKEFDYKPGEHELERASNSYVMSLIALMAGLPLPVINLIATVIFFLGNKKGTRFVRWHCTQALFSQLLMFVMNSACVYWTLSIIFGNNRVDNAFISYVITIIIFNITEFIATIYTAIQIRKGIHIEWWFYGPLTNLVCKS